MTRMVRIGLVTLVAFGVIVGLSSTWDRTTVGPQVPAVPLEEGAELPTMRPDAIMGDDDLSGRDRDTRLRRPSTPPPTSTPPPIGASQDSGLAIAPIRFRLSPGESGPVGFETIGEGYVSHYLYGDPWGGGCLAIRDADTWTAFWDVHTSGIWPQPSAPDVPFDLEMVLGCILGTWTDCCSSYIEITGVEAIGDDYTVSVDAHQESGMLMMVTNPFHLVKVPRTDGRVVFPLPEIPPVP